MSLAISAASAFADLALADFPSLNGCFVSLREHVCRLRKGGRSVSVPTCLFAT